MTWSEPEAAAFLAAHGFGPGPFDIRRMAGGLWNDVLRVDAPQGRFTLKHYAEVLPGTLFPNLPDAEAAALQRLAGLDVAPDLVGFWPNVGVLVYRYVEGQPWQQDVQAVAHLLRRKEAADPAGFRPLPVTPEQVLAQADQLFDRCEATAIVRAWRAVRPVAVPVPDPVRLSLVHTDIGAGNLIGDGAGLRLIDWQCPGAGDLAEDMFTFLSPSFQILNQRPPLQPEQRRLFLDSLHLPNACHRLAMMGPYFAYRMAAYGCLRMQTAPEPDVRDRYGRAVLAELQQHRGLA